MSEQLHLSAAQLIAMLGIAVAIAMVVARLANDWFQRRNAKHLGAQRSHSISSWPGNAGISTHAGAGTTYEPIRRARTARSEHRSRPK